MELTGQSFSNADRPYGVSWWIHRAALDFCERREAGYIRRVNTGYDRELPSVQPSHAAAPRRLVLMGGKRWNEAVVEGNKARGYLLCVLVRRRSGRRRLLYTLHYYELRHVAAAAHQKTAAAGKHPTTSRVIAKTTPKTLSGIVTSSQ